MTTDVRRRYAMRFDPTTIEHLGLKLYASLPPVIGETVSNSWDADATLVEIAIPTETPTAASEVVVSDNGSGMNADALQDAYLHIGRNRRVADKTERSPGGRTVTGRKGLGKLAAFGVAEELEVRTVRNGHAECIRLNYEGMKAVPPDKLYEPELVEERSGPTTDRDGTEVRLRKLRRTKPIDDTWIRRELARRFTLVGKDFVVKVNGGPIGAEDRRFREETRKSWDVTELPGAGLVDEREQLRVTGWIGIVEKASQIDRGVDIFARGKALALNSMFGLSTTHSQFARAYVVGEIHAEFLDQEEDLITTARSDAQWDSGPGGALSVWGEEALKFVFGEWNRLQREIKEAEIRKNTDFDTWLQTRTPRERRVALRIVDALIADDKIDSDAARPLVEVVKSNIEVLAFRELVEDIQNTGGDVPTLLRLVRDWQVVEARELVRLSEGHIAVMEQLEKYIEKGALEVQHMQPLFEENPWLIDPMWIGLTGQTTYTKMLRDKFPESKKTEQERRLDILGISAGTDLHVVELKRPERVLTWEDLDQIERYVTWAQANVAGTPPAPRMVHGRLIVGKLGDDSQVVERRKRLAPQGIAVFTYPDLLQQARTVYGFLRTKLKKLAPEYAESAGRALDASPVASAAAKPLELFDSVPKVAAESATAAPARERTRRGTRGDRRRAGRARKT